MSLPVGCEEPQQAWLGPTATWLVEAPPVAAGQPFKLVLFVRAPAGYRVHAYEVPPLEGIEVIERRILPPADTKAASNDREPGVYRETLIARIRAPGLYLWPATEIRLTDPEGGPLALPLDALEFDVPTVFSEDAPPRRPRGYRPAPPEPFRARFVAGFAAGAACVGAIALALVRRHRRSHRGAMPGAAPGGPYFGGATRLRTNLEQAHALHDPDDASACAALALRHWAADRFLAATHAEATQELRRHGPGRTPSGDALHSTDPPERAEWIAWITRLEAVEAARFGTSNEATRVAAVARAIEEALEFADRVGAGATGQTAMPRDERSSAR